jgi:L-asparaginase/Glu-tRNA(Gln) amidotransferase subunit D
LYSGNGPNLKNEIQAVIEQGIVVVNVTECQKGEVNPSYKSSDGLKGAASMGDMTPEAAFAKLWVCLNYKFHDTQDDNYYTVDKIVEHMQIAWRGETSKSDTFSLYKKGLTM